MIISRGENASAEGVEVRLVDVVGSVGTLLENVVVYDSENVVLVQITREVDNDIRPDNGISSGCERRDGNLPLLNESSSGFHLLATD